MSPLTSFFSATIEKKEAKIDNIVFHAHYRLTSVMLMTAAVLVTSKQHFGNPINCGPAPPGLSIEFLETYCWTRNTFSLMEPKRKISDADANAVYPGVSTGTTGADAVYPGVSTATTDANAVYPGVPTATTGADAVYPGVSTATADDPIVYHNYYQWVWLVLTLQAAMFYLPRYLWKMIEGGEIDRMSDGLIEPLGGVGREKRRAVLVEFIAKATGIQRGRGRGRNAWAFGFFACELLNFVNVVGQMFLTDSFLGGTFFSDFGSRILRFGFLVEEDTTTTSVVFPRVTKCLFNSFGPSGDVQTHDAICVVSFNDANENIYVLLWFWLIVLAIPSAIVLLYRLVLIFVPAVRVLHFRNGYFLRTKLTRVLRNKSIGDWLLIDLLAKNLDTLVFEKVIYDLDNWQFECLPLYIRKVRPKLGLN